MRKAFVESRQAVWHMDVKAQVFAEDEEMTVNRIRILFFFFLPSLLVI